MREREIEGDEVEPVAWHASSLTADPPPPPPPPIPYLSYHILITRSIGANE